VLKRKLEKSLYFGTEAKQSSDLQMENNIFYIMPRGPCLIYNGVMSKRGCILVLLVLKGPRKLPSGR
jgi:hypothetical protein